jgi:predicted kinase
MKSLSLSKPRLIVMVGIPGSGKSFFAEHFADTFKAPIISFHRLRHELFNFPTFSKDEDEIIGRVANYMLDELLRTGRTIVYEGQSSLRTDRAFIAKKSHETGYEPLFVWVQTEPETARKRAIKPSNDKPALSVEQFESKIKQFGVPHRTEKYIVISGKHTHASQLKIVLKHLAEPRAQVQVSQRATVVCPSRNRNILIR